MIRVMPFDNMACTIFLICTCIFAVTQGQIDPLSIRNRKAEMMRSYMNLSVNPCDDFYEYACGNWGKYHPASHSVFETSPIAALKSETNRALVQMFSQYSANDTNIDKKVKDFYVSCISVSQVARPQYNSKLREIINEFGRMPVLEEESTWAGNIFDWERTIGKINRIYGIEILLSYSYTGDGMLQIDHPALDLDDHSHYMEGSGFYLQTYINTIAENLVKYLGVNQYLAGRTAEEIMNFEEQLAKGVSAKQRQPTTISKMTTNYNFKLQIRSFLDEALPKVIQGEVVEVDPKYNKVLIEAIQSAPKQVVANYIFYHLIKPFIQTARSSLMEIHENCITETRSHFQDAVDNLAYRRYEMRHTVKAVTNLFYDLKSIFHNRLYSGQYNWMTTFTRDNALKKLNAMQIIINTFEDVDFNEKYRRVIINNFDYIENLKSILREEALVATLNNGQTEKSTNNLIMYSMQTNNVHVDVPLLTPEYFWSTAYPTSVNFGSFGVRLAHEMLHAFDTVSMSYDENGVQSRWFDLQSRKHVNKGADCLKGQFGSYMYYGQPMVLLESQDMNIADIGAIHLVYDVYKSWRNNAWRPGAVPKEKSYDMLPPLPFSPKQLLFISYAQSWCIDRIGLYRHITTDSSAPVPLRVRSALSNFREVAKTFTCPLGSTMNPDERCEIY